MEPKLIKVDTFSKPVSSCENNFILDFDHVFVDLERVANDCLSIIYQQLPMQTSHSKYRVPPLVLMRFARGGKTITLARVFDKIKEDRRAYPILISFNGSGPTAFKRRDGETQTQAILRFNSRAALRLHFRAGIESSRRSRGVGPLPW